MMMPTYRDLHRALWQWLFDNPEKEKSDWPGWKAIADKPANNCFACEVALYRFRAEEKNFEIEFCTELCCDFCPLDKDIMAYCLLESIDYDYENGYGAYDLWAGSQKLDCVKSAAAAIRDAWPEKKGT